MEKKYTIQCYTNFNVAAPKMTFGQNDSNTSKIEFQIFSDADVPLTDIIDAAITISDKNGLEYTYGVGDDIAIDEHIVTFTLPMSAVNITGPHTGQLYIYGESYERMTISNFKYTIAGELINDNPIQDEVAYPVLTDLIDRVNTAVEEFVASGATPVDLEIVEARKGEANLKSKIDKIDISINDILHYSIKSKNVKPNDTTFDNSDPINQAIAENPIVYIPDGNWYVKRDIVVNLPNKTIIFSPNAKIVVNANFATPCSGLVITADNVQIEYPWIVGNDYNYIEDASTISLKHNSCGVKIFADTGKTVRNVKVYGGIAEKCSGHGFFMRGNVVDSSFTQCEGMYNHECGFEAEIYDFNVRDNGIPTNNRISNCYAHHNDKNGIDFAMADDCTCMNNISVNNGIRPTKNNSEGSGIVSWVGRRNKFIGNIVKHNPQAGFKIVKYTLEDGITNIYGEGLVVEGNTFEDNWQQGIYSDGHRHASILGNTVINCGKGEGFGNSYYDNGSPKPLVAVKEGGIIVLDGDYSTVVGNTVKSDIVYTDGTGLFNKANWTYGIYIDTSSEDLYSCQGNTVSGFTYDVIENSVRKTKNHNTLATKGSYAYKNNIGKNTDGDSKVSTDGNSMQFHMWGSWVSFNKNLSKIKGYSTSKPSTTVGYLSGDIIYNSNPANGAYTGWIFNGTAWVGFGQIGIILSNTASRPSYAEKGYLYFDTDLGKVIFKDTSVWRDPNNGNTV